METKFPYLEFPYPGVSEMAKRQGRRFIKTHLPCHLLPESFQGSNAKVSYFLLEDYVHLIIFYPPDRVHLPQPA